MVPLSSSKISRVPLYSWTHYVFTHTGLSPSVVRLSRLFWLFIISRWPIPRSLATTDGISIDFFSSGYLDVSVLRVASLNLCIQFKVTHKSWVFPFGNFRIKAFIQLPETYRSITRPSSTFSAKASIKCS